MDREFVSGTPCTHDSHPTPPPGEPNAGPNIGRLRIAFLSLKRRIELQPVSGESGRLVTRHLTPSFDLCALNLVAMCSPEAN
jgi:hypothetical protein